MVTSLMVSYTRARAEALIKSCKVGFMERPERIVLVILGALFAKWGVMAPVLWILAVLSTITVIHRIRFTYQMTKHLAPNPSRRPSPGPQRPTRNRPQLHLRPQRPASLASFTKPELIGVR